MMMVKVLTKTDPQMRVHPSPLITVIMGKMGFFFPFLFLYN